MKHPALSLQKSLYLLIFVCWILPLLCTVIWFGQEQEVTNRTNTEEAVVTSVEHSLSELHRRLSDALADSRQISYSKELPNTYQLFQQTNNRVALYGTTSAYLSSQYGANPLFDGAVLLYWTADDLPICTLRQGLLHQTHATQTFQAAARALLPTAKSLDTNASFQLLDGNLYLVRNLVDNHFRPFATLILPFQMDYLLDGGDTILWASEVALSIGDLTLPILGNPAPLQTDALTYPDDSDRFTVGVSSELESTTLHLAVTAQSHLLAGERATIYRSLATIVLLSGALFMLIIRYISQNYAKPMDTLLRGTAHLEGGDLGYQIAPLPQNIEFYQLCERFNLLSTRLADQFERHTLEQEALHEAKIKALQSQINPHFLNNTLEMINWQARLSGDETTAQMIASLSVMLNAAMARDGSATVSFSDEYSYIEAYLYIISHRFGDRLKVNINVDDTIWDASVPRLILQPIVENAVEHGIARRRSGEISLHIFTRDSFLIIEVEHEGVISPDDRAKIDGLLHWDHTTADMKISGRIGIRNVQHRLKMLCGEQSGLTIEEYTAGRVLSRITLPLRTPTGEGEQKQ